MHNSDGINFLGKKHRPGTLLNWQTFQETLHILIVEHVLNENRWFLLQKH
ncbi:hypothetical protein GCHA_3155 [Paraglaciecola chathamensis S18K6]|uniref:Transposase n=2 Tax=Paraglaciecola chathamensis TaxID=368405 RepID=A0ABQ0I2D8_9ALTE|nr:hypothetical protein GAGA_0632 [Paraglaciecola agarilytica NO2]GAC11096.1 hypothetical protein GCHA_3155 [Paraglaciecola chathamensis S18K6]